MSGNSIGKLFVVTTAGESHGPALLAIVDGCPPNMELSESDIQADLDRRRPGQSKFTTQRQESDQIQILSGVFSGKTTGTPIALFIKNEDQRSADYKDLENVFRPGHADFTYAKKYGIRDHCGGGRASARVTAMMVAAGAIAKKYLKQEYGLSIQAYVSQIGQIKAEQIDLSIVETNPFFFPDESKLLSLENLINDLRKNRDSVGAQVTVVAKNVPVGLGEPVFDKLDADIAHIMMGINAVKGVEIGAGFSCVTQKGSEHRDEIRPEGFLSNHSGGTLGGISSGQDLLVNVAFKPTSSIPSLGKTVDVENNPTDISTKGRHDPCVGIRAVPIVEAGLALVLVDHILRHRGQCG